MNAKELETRIEEFFNRWNNVSKEGKELKSRLSKQYNEEHTQTKFSEWKAEKVYNFRKEASEFSDDIDYAVRELNKKAPLAKYPLRYSKDINEKQLSEMVYQRAFNFIQTANNDAVSNEIENVVKIEQKDYASSLLDIIDSRKPNINEFSLLSKENQKFYRDIEAIKKQYESKLGIADISKENNLLQMLKNEIEGFKRATLDGIEYYMSQRIAKKKTQEEMNKAFDENENASAGFEYAGKIIE